MRSLGGIVGLRILSMNDSIRDMHRCCTADIGVYNARITRCATINFEKGIPGLGVNRGHV